MTSVTPKMRALVLLPCLALFALIAPSLSAQPHVRVSVSDAWIRATPPGATTAGGYFTLTNHGREPVRLVSASTPAASKLELHHMSMAGGVMTMRPMPNGATVAPGASLRLAPGGDHLMLTGLKRPLKAGDHVRVVLNLVPGGAMTFDFPVRQDAPMAGMKM